MASSSESSSNRRLQVLGIWAEIIAAVAVVISLIFVGIQVRQTAEETALNTEVTKAAAYAQSVEGLNQWRANIASNAELARLWDSYISGDREIRQAGEEVRLTMLLATLWANYETTYYANEYGLLGASEWERHAGQICRRYRDDSERWIRASEGAGPLSIRTLLSSDFIDHIESSC